MTTAAVGTPAAPIGSTAEAPATTAVGTSGTMLGSQASPANPPPGADPQPPGEQRTTHDPKVPADDKNPANTPVEKKDGEENADSDKPKAEGAPEKYEPFKAPEGLDLDDVVATEFSAVARELNLPQDKAQLLIDKMQPIMAQRQLEQVENMRQTWGDEARKDPEFGGAKLEENLTHAARAMEQFATPKLRELLDESALGNHPEFVRFMVKAGKALAEDRIVPGGNATKTGGIRSLADTLYPTQAVKA